MTKDFVLSLLRESSGDLSGEEISARLGVSRTAVWKAVRQLRREGYAISAGTNRGYRLEALPDLLDAEKIAAFSGISAQKLQIYDIIDSTNRAAKDLAQAGAPSGTAVIADSQTAGRGRRGRTFFSPSGCGVYLSVILRPKVLPEQVMPLTALAAVAACDAVEQVCGVRPQIKWTNDLVLGGRKLAGILTELSLVAETREVEYAVLGIGVNVLPAALPEELQDVVCCLQTQTEARIERNRLCAALLRAFSELERQLCGDCAARMAQYRKDCLNIGKRVKIIRGDMEQEALCTDVGDDGALLVRYADGTEEKIASGEVTVRGLYGYV